MERIFRLAHNLFSLKTEAGGLRKKLPDVAACEYFDHIMSEYGVENMLQIQEKVAEKIFVPYLPATALNKLVFYFALHVLMEPYRRSLVDSFDTSSWHRARCPFCGNKAGLSHLQDNGRRRLICHFCWTEWDYPRVKCFNCEKEANEYAVFEVDGYDTRVDYCGFCKGYIKTVIYEQSEEPYVIWDLKTVSLDDWAVSKGYKKMTPSLVGIDFTK